MDNEQNTGKNRVFEEYHLCSPRKPKKVKVLRFECLSDNESVTNTDCKRCDDDTCPYFGGFDN